MKQEDGPGSLAAISPRQSPEEKATPGATARILPSVATFIFRLKNSRPISQAQDTFRRISRRIRWGLPGASIGTGKGACESRDDQQGAVFAALLRLFLEEFTKDIHRLLVCYAFWQADELWK